MASTKGEVKRVSEDLLMQIVAGRFPAGLRLPPESALAQSYGCGRSTVREALRHLCDLGVVESRQGSGAVVLDYRLEGRSMNLLVPWLVTGQFDQPIELIAQVLLRIRTYLACEGARLAALHADPGDLLRARTIIDNSAALEDKPVEHAQNDLDFHRELGVASRVWPAVWMSNILQEPLSQLSERFGFGIVPKNYCSKMNTILDRIIAKDPDAAVLLLQAHLDEVDEALLNSFRTEALETPSQVVL
jgi:DNA-binding FadR family transcriptional regulator